MSKDKWRDSIIRRYGLALINLPKYCNNYSAKITIKHALACKKCGSVVGQHNEVKVEKGGIFIQDLGSNRVCDEPKIITYRETPDSEMPILVRSHPSPSKLRLDPSNPSPTPPPPSHKHGHFFDYGDLLIQGLWKKQTVCVINTRVINTIQPSYCGSSLAQALASQEKV